MISGFTVSEMRRAGRFTGVRGFRGFSLLELLVVTSVIAVLVAMLLPVLGKAKAAAMLAVCGSTQHQLIVGLAVYAGDNRSALPPHNANGPGNTSYVDWSPRPIAFIMGTNAERMAAGPYGNNMGLGHVIAGGYYSDPNSLKGVFEPTMRFPWSNGGRNTPEGFQAVNTFYWTTYHLTSGGFNAPAVVGSLNGYYYRGWIYSAFADWDAKPRLESMGKKAATWDHMTDWNSQIRVTLTHDASYKVGHYDGHVSLFRDQDAVFTFSNTYWSEASELYTRFDQQ